MKRIRTMALLICCAMLVFSSLQIALAFSSAPTVSYNGKEHKFSFINVKNKDLFPDFKDVMPGDKIEQKINVAVENFQNTADLYLRAKSTDGVKIPETITLKVYHENQEISKSSLNSQGALEKGVLLHHFTKSETVELTVVLEVPNSIGNEISDVRKEISWIFTIQEEEARDDKSESQDDKKDHTQSVAVPKTGDLQTPLLCVGLCGCSLIGIAVLGILKKREKKETT